MAEEEIAKKSTRRRKSKKASGEASAKAAPKKRTTRKKASSAKASPPTAPSVESPVKEAPAPAAEVKPDPMLKAEAPKPEDGKALQKKKEPEAKVEEVAEAKTMVGNRTFKKKGTMTVKTIKKDRCYYGAKRFRFDKGEMLTLPEEQAKWLINTGRAVG